MVLFQYVYRLWRDLGQKGYEFEVTQEVSLVARRVLLGIVLRSQLQSSVECTKMSLKVAQGGQNVAKWTTLVYLGVAKGGKMHKKWK